MQRLNSSIFVKKWALIFFWTALFITTILMFIPGKPPKQEGFMHWDKIQHALAFMLLIKLAWFAYPQKKLLSSILLVIFGAAIEILQATLTTTRTGTAGDWIADVVGIMIGMTICITLFQKNRQLKQIRQ